MAKVIVPVLKSLTYQGRTYVRGEALELEAVEALRLGRRGEVLLTRDVSIAAKVPPTGWARPRGPRGQYRRRDLNADPVTE